ncbi:cytosine permease [Alkalicoccus saliphilus]|uniref:Cytosine permease n=1 Tax=Alkalicoccus saliphilus TaxID=200989 RepID=A0A2T4UA56_9BACI|nr:cytosine permease [Alkalicoccus saliphilus]PTL40285.1 cytosine permease [Alkalicoccus saliphilus]
MGYSEKFETIGLKPVPDSMKTASVWDYIRMQAAINVNAGNMLLPALAVLEGGLTFYEAVLVTLAGAVPAYILVSVMSLPGSREGIPAQFAVRSLLGSSGSMLFSSPVRTLTSLYWFSVQAVGGAYLIHSLLGDAGVSVPFTALTVLLASIMVFTAMIGFQAMRTFAVWFTPVLILGAAAMILTFLGDGLPDAASGGGGVSTMIFYGSLVFVQYISGVSTSSDLTRYAKSPVHGTAGLFAGNTIGFIFTAVLGAWAAASGGEWNAFLSAAERTENQILFLVIIMAALGSMLIINVNNAYTGGYSLLNSIPAAGRLRSALLFGGAAVLLSALPQVVDRAEEFISVLGMFIIPLSAVISGEYIFVHKNKLKGVKEKLNVRAGLITILGSTVYFFFPPSFFPGITVFLLIFAVYILVSIVNKKNSAGH